MELSISIYAWSSLGDTHYEVGEIGDLWRTLNTLFTLTLTEIQYNMVCERKKNALCNSLLISINSFAVSELCLFIINMYLFFYWSTCCYCLCVWQLLSVENMKPVHEHLYGCPIFFLFVVELSRFIFHFSSYIFAL